MSIVAVTGANGFVGGAVVDHLTEQDVSVRPLVRRGGTPGLVAPDLGSAADWSALLSGCDSVVHCAARVHMLQEVTDALALYREVNVAGTRRLAEQAARVGVRRFVFVSSIKVNGESTGGAQEPPIFRSADRPAPQGAYALSKIEAERALFEIASRTGLEVVIIRPPLVYGPGVRANFLRLMTWVDRGIPLPLGSIDNRRSMVFVRNLASLVSACITAREAVGQVLLVSDGEDVSTPGLVRILAGAMARPARILPVPKSVLRSAARLLGRSDEVDRLLGSLQVDIEPTRRLLGWSPPVSLPTGIVETSNHFKGARS
ncbi:MAG: SDR family oxidoreductase [Pseudomonadota bacterium]